MASKRYLESVNPVIFNKLPRLEAEPSFPSSRIQSKPSPVPNPGSENHFNYKGSYFTCPLQSPKGPEQPQGCWSPTYSYLHYSPGAMSQPVPAEGSLAGLLLYPSDSLGTQKGKDSLVQEQLMARKKLDSPRCPLPVRKPVVVNKAAPLAVPRPVYGAPTCFLAPRVAVPLGTRVEGLQQSPGEANWALPPTSHPLHPGEPHRRVPCSDLPLLSTLVMPAKEQLASPVTSSHYYVTFDKYRPRPSCATAHGQKKVPEVPSPDSWPKPQLPDATLANRERPTMFYSPSHYPVSPHRAAPLYHSPAPTVGEPGALPSFSFVENREPFPSSYLRPQAPRSYFASPLDPCVPRTVGGSVVASPPAKPVAVLRDAEVPKDVELPRYPGFTFSPGDASMFHTPFASPEPGCEQHRVEVQRWQVETKHSSAFQPVCIPEKPSNGLMETSSKREGSWEKPKQGEQEPPYLERRNTSPAPQDTHSGGQVISIIVGNGNACKVKDPTEELVHPSPSVTPPKGMEDLRDTRVLSSSPPMPVIHNVFSLAPFQDYLERTKSSAQLFCKEHPWGDPPPQDTGSSQEPASLRDTSVVSSQGSDSSMGHSQEESCYRRAPKKPKPEPQEPEPEEGSPDGVDTEELHCEDLVLDLSLRKRPVEVPGNPQELTSFVVVTVGQEDVEEEKEAAEGKVKVEEGAELQLLDVGSGDRSNFQSSATFVFKKFKLPRSVLPSSESPHGNGSPHPRPSPPSSTPAPAPPAPSPSSSSPVPPAGPQPSTISGPNPPQPAPPKAPCTPGEESLSLARPVGVPPPEAPSGQSFLSLHTWLCDTISGSVSRSSPELLQQWLKKAESAEEPGEMPKSLPKPTNGSKAPTAQKPTKGKEIWLAFQDVATLLARLLSQLETFMSVCPFPHVVRAGAVFIPIHVVKEKLFPKLPRTSVDLVLQKHKVELRPTTLSEERHLRDLELKSCTSRMLKLLALKQLPEIYPDLLNLHWHNSIRQQLGSSGLETLKADGKATEKKDGLRHVPRTAAT